MITKLIFICILKFIFYISNLKCNLIVCNVMGFYISNPNVKAVLNNKISMTFLSFTKSKINQNNQYQYSFLV